MNVTQTYFAGRHAGHCEVTFYELQSVKRASFIVLDKTAETAWLVYVAT